MLFLHKFVVFFLPLHDVYEAPYIQYYSPEFWENNPRTNHSGGIRTHDVCTARADILPLDHRASPMARGRSESLAAGTAMI